MRWRTSRAHLVAAFAAALGVHLVLGLLVVLAPRPPDVPRRLAVELRTSAPEHRPGRPTEGPAPTGREPEPRPPGARSEAGPKPPAPKMPKASADASDSASPAPKAPATEPSRTGDGRGHRGGPERGTKEWLAAEGLGREGARPSLTLRDPLGSLSGPAPSAGPAQGPVRVPTKEEQLVEEKTQVAARIGGWTREMLARHRAEEPHDVYWRWMQDALAKGFAVDTGIGKLRVLVRIVQREDGSVESANVAGSSGNHSYDDRAIEQARSLGRNLLGAPPGGHRQTLWAFETDVLIFPPLPLAGCTLDSNLAPAECFYPFKKYGRPRVKLQAIY